MSPTPGFVGSSGGRSESDTRAGDGSLHGKVWGNLFQKEPQSLPKQNQMCVVWVSGAQEAPSPGAEVSQGGGIMTTGSGLSAALMMVGQRTQPISTCGGSQPTGTLKYTMRLIGFNDHIF